MIWTCAFVLSAVIVHKLCHVFCSTPAVCYSAWHMVWAGVIIQYVRSNNECDMSKYLNPAVIQLLLVIFLRSHLVWFVIINLNISVFPLLFCLTFHESHAIYHLSWKKRHVWTVPLSMCMSRMHIHQCVVP